MVLDEHNLSGTDIEIQVMESENGLNDKNCNYLKDFYIIQDEQLEQGNKVELEIIIALFDNYGNLDDIRNILNDNIYYIYKGEGFNPELDAFLYYCDEIEEIEYRMPYELRNYFDYKSYYRDCGFNGMTTIELKDNYYMFVFY